MIPLTAMAQAPQEVEIKGEGYMLSPLTLADVASMMRWFCDRPLEKCKAELANYGEMYDDKTRRRTVAKAKEEHERRVEVTNGLDIDPDIVEQVKKEMNREYSSVDGVARMLWLSIRKNRPDATLEEVAELVDMSSLVAIKGLIDGMMFAPAPDEIDDDEKKTGTDGAP